MPNRSHTYNSGTEKKNTLAESYSILDEAEWINEVKTKTMKLTQTQQHKTKEFKKGRYLKESMAQH